MPKLSSFLLAAAACIVPYAASARQPADLAGTWELSFDKTGSVCRVLLRAEMTDKGDYFLGMPTACRHAMPGIAAVGRWSMPDDGHIVLGDPGGAKLVILDAAADGFAGAGPVGTYTLKPLASGRSAVSSGLTPIDPVPALASPKVAETPAQPLLLERIASRHAKSETNEPPAESREDLPGRYAVMREKHDTGCMITLDKSRSSGADRAQLAPGCRDQGIVIFDPSSWQLVKGQLVLTAKAGHKTTLEKQAEGQWEKAQKEGGKPLGLKKL